MSLISGWVDAVAGLRARTREMRVRRRWERLRELGMQIGEDVWLPGSTWIDPDYCFLISIGDHCGFGEECMILAHDAQMDEFLDAARVGRVIIHPSCHIGARSVILPGVEIGPRTIVGAHSVVSKSLPPDSVCTGAPARVLCSLDDYLERHRARIASSPTFAYSKEPLTLDQRRQIIEATMTRDAYIVGGRSAELRGAGGTPRTSFLAPRSDT